MKASSKRSMLLLLMCSGCAEQARTGEPGATPHAAAGTSSQRHSLFEAEPAMLHASWGSVESHDDDGAAAVPEHPTLPLGDQGAARYEFQRTAAARWQGTEVFVR